MRIMALIASYNEARFIQHTIRHLARHGVESYLIDNESTDGTLELARELTGQGLAGWERLPRQEIFEWGKILAAKERAAQHLRADWFIHQDCDEFRLPPPGMGTLGEALTEVDRQGFNAVHFDEYTFQPVLEAPDHEHDRFLDTMRWYYPFAPFPQHRLNAWKVMPHPVDLQASGGHQAHFPGRRIAPMAFRMRHYLMLSRRQAIAKYQRVNDRESILRGWHGWRSHPPFGPLLLPPARALLTYTGDADLKPGPTPLPNHILGDLWVGKMPTFPNAPGWRWRMKFWLNRRTAPPH